MYLLNDILDECIVAKTLYRAGGEYWSTEADIKLYLINGNYVLVFDRRGTTPGEKWQSKNIEVVLKAIDEYTKKNISKELKNDMIRRLAGIDGI